jgi:hypothetical protein
VHTRSIYVHKQNGITSIYVYRPDLTQLHAVIGGVSILREPSTVSKERIPVNPVSTKASVGKNRVNQIRSRRIHQAPLARQGEGALSPLFVVIGSLNRTRAHQKIYFLRRCLATGGETGDGDDGSADGREKEEANAASLLFLRNSQ